MQKFWWQDKLIYQIYPMSFYDSNGDGIGDIPGIISKLDYLSDLGVDLIWISPLYPSPNRDNGYDISDYLDIHPNYGTLEDFDRLVAEAAKRKMRIIMDLVINHTSDQHEWFQKSRRRIEPYTDYYIWRPGKENSDHTFNNAKKPNNWGNFFGEDPWTYDPVRKEYYLHLFAAEQPDLNYHNEKVIRSIEEILRFWLDRGVAGFRCDVINILYKDSLENGKWRPALTGSEHFISTPGLHPILKRLNQNVLSKYDAFTVGETVFVDPDMARDLTAPERQELSSVFSFEHMETDCFKIKWFLRPFKPKRFFKTLSKWQKALFWNTLYFENHDQPRSVSRFGNAENYHNQSAKALAILLLGLKGTVFLYQGQEIGMTNFHFEVLSDLKDIESQNIWKLGRKLHIPKKILWKMLQAKSRDHARTPMQWSDSINAGFTEGEPWLTVNPGFLQHNVEQNLADENSVLCFYRRLIAFRKKNEALVFGDYREDILRGSLFAFSRILGDEQYRVVINLSEHRCKNPYPGTCLFHSYEEAEAGDYLKPYEAFIQMKEGK